MNADLIASGLSPFGPDAAAIRAGRVMLEEIDSNTAAGRSFAFEIHAGGTHVLAENQRMAEGGYVVEMLFLYVSATEHALTDFWRRPRGVSIGDKYPAAAQQWMRVPQWVKGGAGGAGVGGISVARNARDCENSGGYGCN